jgi:hypothetical protein
MTEQNINTTVKLNLIKLFLLFFKLMNSRFKKLLNHKIIIQMNPKI